MASALVNASVRKKRKMTECFWCNEVFDNVDHDTCPNCARDTHTKEIPIINIKENEDGEDGITA